MSSTTNSQRPALYAKILVGGAAAGGVVACSLGAIHWGLLGLTVGMAGAWGLFLLGLFSMYQNEERRERRLADAHALEEHETLHPHVAGAQFR
ncbi:MAG TPA: hypothetical protein VHF69_00015 [Candidatus Synoicihabitans sp.]|nr:hypothetical protein [Candidatus Synoicihabitans sp.]